MKPDFMRALIALLLLASVPSVFNSCKGGLLGGGAPGSPTAVCKMAIEDQAFKRVYLDPSAVPEIFSRNKVRLRPDPEPGAADGVQGKAATATHMVAAGTELAALIDNSCLLERGADANPVIGRQALESGRYSPAFDRQTYLWTLEQDQSESELEATAAAEPCVIGVGHNRKYRLHAMTFNDPSFSQQSHFPAIHAAEAYDRFYDPGTGMAKTGTSTQIAVIDTGVDWTHPDIQPNLWLHSQGAGIDITTVRGTTISYDPADISDIGHGTHVSGLIAAAANNSRGTVGLMPYRAKVMGIKVFKLDTAGELTTSSQYFADALQFAWKNGAKVINLSLGSVDSGPAFDAVAEAAVDEAVRNGAVVVVVIGNADSGNGVNIDGNLMSSIPGQYATKPGVIGVGSFDAATGQKSYFSHYSTKYVELGAPGADNGNTGLLSTLPVNQSSYGRLAGTSQAAPLVSAAAGLTMSLIRKKRGTWPTPAEVERLLLASAVKSPQLTNYFLSGNRLDLANLAQKISTDYPGTLAGSATCP